MRDVKKRVAKLIKLITPDESFIMVYGPPRPAEIPGEGPPPDGAPEYTMTCTARQDGCPPFPCIDSPKCWVHQKYPGMIRIDVGARMAEKRGEAVND